MHRKHEIDVAARSETGKRAADSNEAFAETLAAWRGDENHSSHRWRRARRFQPRPNPEQRVDARVAGDMNLAGDALVREIRRGLGGRREVNRRQAGGQHAVHLLWKWLAHVARAQPGLDVRHFDAAIEAGQRAA